MVIIIPGFVVFLMSQYLGGDSNPIQSNSKDFGNGRDICLVQC
jgi:hypothetical protein